MVDMPLVILDKSPITAAHMLLDGDVSVQHRLADDTLRQMVCAFCEVESQQHITQLLKSSPNMRAWFGYEPHLLEYYKALCKRLGVDAGCKFDMFEGLVRAPSWVGTKSHKCLVLRMFLYRCIQTINIKLQDREWIDYCRPLSENEARARGYHPDSRFGCVAVRLGGRWHGEDWRSYSLMNVTRVARFVYNTFANNFFNRQPYRRTIGEMEISLNCNMRVGEPRSVPSKEAFRIMRARKC